MIKETPCNKKPQTTNQLDNLRMIDHRNIKQTVVWHGIGCLSVSRTASHTYRHDPSLYYIRIYFHIHLIIKTMENH